MRLLGLVGTVGDLLLGSRSAPCLSFPAVIATRLAALIASEDSSRPLWRHPASIAAAVLALMLARSRCCPTVTTTRARSPRPARPRDAPDAASGVGRVTPAMRPRSTGSSRAGASLARAPGAHVAGHAAGALRRVRGPALLPRHRLDRPDPGDDRSRPGSTAPSAPAAASSTGDLDADGLLARASSRRRRPQPRPSARSSPRPPGRSPRSGCCGTRSRACRCPPASSSEHPEVGRRADVHGTRRVRRVDYPTTRRCSPARWPAQVRTYWCGPTTMQMIAWGWQASGSPRSYWARRLGTTTNGTAITDMVRVVNTSTGYDREAHAGPYIVLDISDWYLPAVAAAADAAHHRTTARRSCCTRSC